MGRISRKTPKRITPHSTSSARKKTHRAGLGYFLKRTRRVFTGAFGGKENGGPELNKREKKIW